MKIAIPLENGKSAMHCGDCERFALFDVDPTDRKILKRVDITPPSHDPGLLSLCLAARGTNMIIAGDMGQSELFAQKGIEVVVGAFAETPERLVGDYLSGTQQVGKGLR